MSGGQEKNILSSPVIKICLPSISPMTMVPSTQWEFKSMAVDWTLRASDTGKLSKMCERKEVHSKEVYVETLHNVWMRTKISSEGLVSPIRGTSIWGSTPKLRPTSSIKWYVTIKRYPHLGEDSRGNRNLCLQHFCWHLKTSSVHRVKWQTQQTSSGGKREKAWIEQDINEIRSKSCQLPPFSDFNYESTGNQGRSLRELATVSEENLPPLSLMTASQKLS